jgi:periplasmic divalent cation tolerance protein
MKAIPNAHLVSGALISWYGTWKIIVTSLEVPLLDFIQVMTDPIVVLNTCASQEEAERLARLLVDLRLAACVSIVPRVRSVYRWQGVVESTDECLLLIKSSRLLFDPLCAALENGHTYEIPEVLALPVVAGSTPYLDWLQSNLQEGATPQ